MSEKSNCQKLDTEKQKRKIDTKEWMLEKIFNQKKNYAK